MKGVRLILAVAVFAVMVALVGLGILITTVNVTSQNPGTLPEKVALRPESPSAVPEAAEARPVKSSPHWSLRKTGRPKTEDATEVGGEPGLAESTPENGEEPNRGEDPPGSVEEEMFKNQREVEITDMWMTPSGGVAATSRTKQPEAIKKAIAEGRFSLIKAENNNMGTSYVYELTLDSGEKVKYATGKMLHDPDTQKQHHVELRTAMEKGQGEVVRVIDTPDGPTYIYRVILSDGTFGTYGSNRAPKEAK